MRPGRVRDAILLLTVGVYPAGFAGPPLVALALVSAAESVARSWRWIPTSLDRPLLAFGLAALASAIISPWRGTALLSVVVLAVVTLVAVRSTLAYAQGGPGRVPQLLRIWIAGGTGAALWVLLRAQAAGWTRWSTNALEQNGLGSTLAVTAILAAGLLLFAAARSRWLPVALAVLLAGLMVTFARASWLGLLAGAAVLLAMSHPRARLLLTAAGVVALVGGVLLVPQWPPLHREVRSIVSLQANRNRLALWETAARMVADHPLLGIGFGAFPLAYPRYKAPDAPDPAANFAHDILLNVAAETGVIGLAAFTILCAVALQAMARWWWCASPTPSSPRPATVTLLVIQLFEGTVMFAHLGVGLLVLFALGVAGEKSLAAGNEQPSLL